MTEPQAAALPIAVIGDVHRCWDAEDVRQLDHRDYALVLFVGDLAGYRHRGGLRTARAIGRLQSEALVLPGNHDGTHLLQLASEVFDWRLRRYLGGMQARRCEALERALGAGRLVGFSRRSLAPHGLDATLIACRPHSFGGPRLAFARHMRRHFGVSSLEHSAERLCELVDAAEHDRLVFLAHNGPTGLGEGRGDIWGRDFGGEEGDWGDPDLRVAIDHARSRGKRVLAVVAGHMHHALRGGGQRQWSVRQDGILYVNAARVPRIFEQGGRTVRHHVRLVLRPDRASAEQVLV